jgi:hypothetical protein
MEYWGLPSPAPGSSSILLGVLRGVAPLHKTTHGTVGVGAQRGIQSKKVIEHYLSSQVSLKEHLGGSISGTRMVSLKLIYSPGLLCMGRFLQEKIY